jgi:hypothetical protein
MFVCVLVLGCASKVYDHPALATPDTPMAELTVIRKKAFGGGAVPLTVELNGEKLVRLWVGSYAVMQVVPNNYSLTFYNPKTGITAEALVDLEAGERAYVLLELEGVGIAASGGVSVSGGSVTSSSGAMPVGLFGLHPIPEQQAREFMSIYDPVGSD